MKKLAILVAAGLGTGVLFAQNEETRAAEIATQQQQKAAHLVPYEPGKIERGMLWVREQSFVDRLVNGASGVFPKFGGMSPEAGVGFGAQYGWTGRQLQFRTSAVAATSRSWKVDGLLAAPKLSNSRYFAEVYTVHHDYRRLSYYGSGPDSEKFNRNRYQLEDTAIDGRIGIRPAKHLSLGTSMGYVSTKAADLDRVGYTRLAGFAQYDWRDEAGRKGGNYFATFSDYRDFRRLDVEAQQYIPFLNDRRVFAFRAKSSMLYKPAGTVVPFYMQPMLSGSEDLRGYRPYRFRGDNTMVMTGEYRFEVFSGMDMALFADAGKVTNRRGDLNFRNLESDAGFGFRFNARNKTFLRLDVAFSHEGVQVWVKFNNVFRNGPAHTSSSMGEY